MTSSTIDRKRMFLATIASGLSMWLLAGLWHLVIVPGFYARSTGAEHHEGGWMISVGYVMLAAIMSWAFPRFHRGGNRLLMGLGFGALTGLLWVTPHALVRAGAHASGHGAALSYLLINGGWHLVEQGLGGVIIALIFSATLQTTRKETNQ
jgi:hypothetical protein